jgi:hypothetical protein
LTFRENCAPLTWDNHYQILSKVDDEHGRSVCHHEHSPKCEVMWQDVALLHALREAITVYSNDKDRKDHLWSLDREQGLRNE